jgi:glutamine synthetase
VDPFLLAQGKALDEKTPLLRAENALSVQGKRLFKLLGHEIDGLTTNIGLEQELFFVPTDAFYKRPDLQMCGRTVIGAKPALDQEALTHYMAPINTQKTVCDTNRQTRVPRFRTLKFTRSNRKRDCLVLFHGLCVRSL